MIYVNVHTLSRCTCVGFMKARLIDVQIFNSDNNTVVSRKRAVQAQTGGGLTFEVSVLLPTAAAQIVYVQW